MSLNLAGFRHAREDPIDAALRNWAIWATVGISSTDTSNSGTGKEYDTDGTKREAYYETKVPSQVGWALDVEAELGEVQAQIDLRQGKWNVRDTVKRWYAGTYTDELEAEYLGIPRSTFSDRIDQIKRRIQALRDARPIKKGRTIEA